MTKTYSMLEGGKSVRSSDGVVIAILEESQNPHYLEYVAWLNSGNSPDPFVQSYADRDPEYIIADATKRTQDRLDDFAKTRNYDGILSAATYATSTVSKFALEGQYAVVARDATWAALYAMMEEVQTGQRAMPANYAEVESELPPLEWPNE